jgi:hypothetical protein
MWKKVCELTKVLKDKVVEFGKRIFGLIKSK